MPGPWANGLSVGDVAGILAAGISVVHTTIPLLAALVIIALVSRGGNSAASWSVASRSIQGSLWPWILRGDGSATKHVPWPVIVYSTVVTIAMIILIPVHFFTPLPLVSEIGVVKTPKNVTFAYMPDTSFIGLGTPPRVAKSITRLCTQGPNNTFAGCPHSEYTPPSGTSPFFKGQRIVNTTIPLATSDLFTFDERSTIAGPLDIQFRNLVSRSDDYIDAGALQLIGGFLAFESFLLEDSYRLIEGIIVDSKNGAIGLRNHTMPTDMEFGASWSEDILWITPVTSCTNTNLTFGFKISENRFFDPSFGTETYQGTLRDDGGFANLAFQPPGPSWLTYGGPGALWNISGPVPDLQSRAAQAAFWNNIFIRDDLGIEDPIEGEVYYNNSFYNYTYENRLPGAIEISPMNGAFFNTTLFGEPLKFDSNDFTAFGVRCGGFESSEMINPSKPYIRCGYLYGVPEPVQQGQWAFNLGSQWTQSLYTCASAVKASVKTVHFKSTGTSSLQDLEVVDVVDKVYDASAEPFWAVENIRDYMVEGIDLFWGLIPGDRAKNANLLVRRASEYYLPVSTGERMLGYWLDGFAAGSAFTTAWNTVYEMAAQIAGCGVLGVPGYSGENNYELTLKYRSLTTSAGGAAHLLNLIWTDLAAWSVVGTKTGFEGESSSHPSKRSTSSSKVGAGLGVREVYPHKQFVKYSNLLYAIPAFFVAGLWLFLLLSVLVLCCGWGRAPKIRWKMVNHYVNQTGMGRVATNAMHLTDYDPVARTSDWLVRAGHLILNVPPWTTPRSSTRAGGPQPRSTSSPPFSSSQTLQGSFRSSVPGDYELHTRSSLYQQIPQRAAPAEAQQRWRTPYQRQHSDSDYEHLRHPAPVFEASELPDQSTDDSSWIDRITRFGSLNRGRWSSGSQGWEPLRSQHHLPPHADAENEEAVL